MKHLPASTREFLLDAEVFGIGQLGHECPEHARNPLKFQSEITIH